MRAPISVRTREGRELTPGSLADFVRLLKAGEITQFDLIFDQLTGEWAPAQAHPVFRMVADSILDEDDFRPEPRRRPEPGRASPPSETKPPAPEPGPAGEPPTPGTVGLDLSLAPVVEATPEEAAAAFITKMEEERAADRSRPPTDDGLKLTSGSSGVGRTVFDLDDPSVEAMRRRARRVRASALSASEKPQRRAVPAGGRVLWMMGVLMLVTAGVAAPTAWRLAGDEEVTARSAVTGPRLITTDERAFRGQVADGVYRDVRGLMTELELGPVPAIWLDGAYLADAVSYPEVRDTWERYLRFVWALRATEERRYSDAYRAELDRTDVQAPVRTMRLAAAMIDFRTAAPRRQARYDRIEEIAIASLSLHDLLVHLTGAVQHVPARANRVSVDPVVEAVGVDEGAQEMLDRALDRVVRAMAADQGGPGEISDVPGWVRASVAGALNASSMP